MAMAVTVTTVTAGFSTGETRRAKCGAAQGTTQCRRLSSPGAVDDLVSRKYPEDDTFGSHLPNPPCCQFFDDMRYLVNNHPTFHVVHVPDLHRCRQAQHGLTDTVFCLGCIPPSLTLSLSFVAPTVAWRERRVGGGWMGCGRSCVDDGLQAALRKGDRFCKYRYGQHLTDVLTCAAYGRWVAGGHFLKFGQVSGEEPPPLVSTLLCSSSL